MKLKFALRFVAAFSLLLASWAVSEFGSAYRAAALAVTKVLSPLLTGWWMAPGEAEAHAVATFEKEQLRIVLQIDPASLSMAQVPLLALIWATPGLGFRGTLVRSIVGLAAFFLVHVSVLLVYPVLLANPNWFMDTIGVFTGLLSFVLAPQLLWFVLTYTRLKELWQLGGR
ncbi:hypothetical protein HRbin30_01854 [bacterium HR30]|nr:hypothetical protein HRbin30_01854 [bacterium HR30]